MTKDLKPHKDRWYWHFGYMREPVVRILGLGFFSVCWWADSMNRFNNGRRWMLSLNRD